MGKSTYINLIDFLTRSEPIHSDIKIPTYLKTALIKLTSRLNERTACVIPPDKA
jgi:hypothetical protein